MLRALLMGLVAVVIAIFVISVLVHILYFGVLLVVVAGITFLVFRASRGAGRRFGR